MDKETKQRIRELKALIKKEKLLLDNTLSRLDLLGYENYQYDLTDETANHIMLIAIMHYHKRTTTLKANLKLEIKNSKK